MRRFFHNHSTLKGIVAVAVAVHIKMDPNFLLINFTINIRIEAL